MISLFFKSNKCPEEENRSESQSEAVFKAEPPNSRINTNLEAENYVKLFDVKSFKKDYTKGSRNETITSAQNNVVKLAFDMRSLDQERKRCEKNTLRP